MESLTEQSLSSEVTLTVTRYDLKECSTFDCNNLLRRKIMKYKSTLNNLIDLIRHDTQQNDIQHNDTHHKGLICYTQHNNTQYRVQLC